MTFIDWLFGNGISRLDPSEYMYKTKHIITLLLVVLLSVILALVFRKNKKRTAYSTQLNHWNINIFLK